MRPAGGGAYSIGDLQDGVYTATAASGDDDNQLLTLLTGLPK